MWRKISVIVLLASVTEAQMVAATGDPQAPQERQVQLATPTQSGPEMSSPIPPGAGTFLDATGTPSPTPVVSSYARYSQLRRGREEEVVVLLCQPGGSVRVCSFDPAHQVGLVPLTLELKPVAGFAVSYLQGDEFRSQQQGPAVATGIGSKVFRLKIRAEKNVPLGAYHLEGKLTFRTINTGKLSDVQQLDVVIPLTVLEHDAYVSKARWSLDKHKQHDWGTAILIVLTAPFWGPLFLMFVIGCEISDCR